MKFKTLFIVFALLFSLSACSKNDTLTTLNTIGLGKIVLNQDKRVISTYKKYASLLNEVEKKQAITAYNDVKVALKDIDLATIIKYQKAKASYALVLPIYQKYKEQISPIDKPFIEGVHNKLTAITSAIEQAKDKAIKDELIIEYLRTITILATAFV